MTQTADVLSSSRAARPSIGVLRLGLGASWIGAVVRDPLTHFLLLGLVLFGAAQAWSHFHDPRTIVVSRAQIDMIAADYSRRMGEPPSPAALRAAVETYIGDEALYREGLARGVDRGDELVRRRIIQKMEFAQEDAGDATAVSEADLRKFYAQHQALYALPPRVTFQHIYFSTDAGETEAVARAKAALSHLRAGASEADLGDAFPDRTVFTDVNETDVEHVFGRSALAEALFSAPVGVWSGPATSGFGVHLFKVQERAAAQVQPFEAVRSRVESDARYDALQARSRAMVARAVSHFKVILPDFEHVSPGQAQADAKTPNLGED